MEKERIKTYSYLTTLKHTQLSLSTIRIKITDPIITIISKVFQRSKTLLMTRLMNSITFRRKNKWLRSCGLLNLRLCVIDQEECQQIQLLTQPHQAIESLTHLHSLVRTCQHLQIKEAFSLGSEHSTTKSSSNNKKNRSLPCSQINSIISKFL